MRRLFLLRHSESERSVPGASDRDRTLTERGRTDARSIGAYMARHGFVPDIVWMSPALRARETWKQAAAAFHPAPPAQAAAPLYDATAHAIFNAIAEAPPQRQSLLIIGHNPALHELAMLLIASGDIEARALLRENLPTSGLVIIGFSLDDWSKLHPHAGRLEHFVSPKTIAPATN
ncbi:MAG TPA: histidine phosphatase family protein [Pseudolabrys sp.]|nr:histidine phosphatase family protein [Pseudolabrys sp.]